jgi:uncharacterized membrane protein YdbT with pleckstrin-like domain
MLTRGYFSKTPFLLFPGEELIFKTNPSWLLLIWPVSLMLTVWLLYLLFLVPSAMFINFGGFCLILSTLAFSFAIGVYYLDWRFNRLSLTNLRLVKERGIIGQSFMSIFLEQVEDITVSYGFWGRLFNFGDLKIESAGTCGKLVFKGIPKPLKKMGVIESEIQKMKKQQ